MKSIAKKNVKVFLDDSIRQFRKEILKKWKKLSTFMVYIYTFCQVPSCKDMRVFISFRLVSYGNIWFCLSGVNRNLGSYVCAKYVLNWWQSFNMGVFYELYYFTFIDMDKVRYESKIRFEWTKLLLQFPVLVRGIILDRKRRVTAQYMKECDRSTCL